MTNQVRENRFNAFYVLDGVALIKIMDKYTVIRIRDEKKMKEELKMNEKMERLRIEEEKRKDKLRKGQIKPSDMFKTQDSIKLFSAWDETVHIKSLNLISGVANH